MRPAAPPPASQRGAQVSEEASRPDTAAPGDTLALTLEQAIAIALENNRLVKNATLMGGNAVVSMRFDSSEMATTMTEIVAYGTAVVIEPDAGAPQATE